MTIDCTIRDEYLGRHATLVKTADKLQAYLRDLVSGLPRIDSVLVRAKDPDRYFDKAMKVNESGQPKYPNPRFGIQDQIGARINVLYLSDVECVRLRMVDFMKYIEESPKSPDDDAAFGYFGYHFIFQTPDEIIAVDEKEAVPEFFELQIKTLFQHAWSETHHDLGYKTPRKLTSNERRQIAFTAAQAWGADKIFDELAKTIVDNDNDPTEPL
jgi:putative GTP pyrophosphokinase